MDRDRELCTKATLRRLGHDPGPHLSLVLVVAVTTLCWLTATYLTDRTDMKTLEAFCKRVRPPRAGWRMVYEQSETRPRSIGAAFAAWPVATVMNYSLMLGGGALLFGNLRGASIGFAIVVVCIPILLRLGRRALADAAGG